MELAKDNMHSKLQTGHIQVAISTLQPAKLSLKKELSLPGSMMVPKPTETGRSLQQSSARLMPVSIMDVVSLILLIALFSHILSLQIGPRAPLMILLGVKLAHIQKIKLAGELAQTGFTTTLDFAGSLQAHSPVKT